MLYISYVRPSTCCDDLIVSGQAITLLEEMNSSGIQPYPPAHRAAIAAVAAAEGHQGAMAVLADMKVGPEDGRPVEQGGGVP